MKLTKGIKTLIILASSIITLIALYFIGNFSYKFILSSLLLQNKKQVIINKKLQSNNYIQIEQQKNNKKSPNNVLNPSESLKQTNNKQLQKTTIPNYNFDKLFKIGRIIVDNPKKPHTALVILNKSQVNPNIKVVYNVSTVTKKINGITELLVVCETPNSGEQAIIDFFINKNNSKKTQVAEYFTNLYSPNTPGFVGSAGKIQEHGSFFFLYNNQFCYPYPILLQGSSKEIVDPRRTIFWNWNEAIRDKIYRPIYKAKLIVTSHNHPMDHGFTDYASAEDFGSTFFPYSPYGIAVVGKTGVYMARIKSQKALKELQKYYFKDLIMSKIIPLREKYKANNPDFLYDKNYRLEQRNIIFSIPQVKEALEDFFVQTK